MGGDSPPRLGPSLRRVAAVVGVGHTDWVNDYALVRSGKQPFDSYGYGALAFQRALTDAGVKRADVNGLIVDHYSLAYERTAEILGMEPKWGGQADAILAVIQACMAIETGLADIVALVYGSAQRSEGVQYGGTKPMGADTFLSYIYHSPWGLTSQGALYALMFRRYMHDTGFTEADLGHVAIAQRSFAAMNPNAIMRQQISMEDYLASRYVCEPLRLLDYCLVNDGGVALIIAESGLAKRISPMPVYIEAAARQDLNIGATSLEPRLTEFYRPAQKAVTEALFGISGFEHKDVNAFQVYDSFSVHVPLALEGYGYCAIGDVSRFLKEEGIGPRGRLPTNTSGGHLSESYMMGWNHQVECVRQIRGVAGMRQIEGCRLVHYASDVAGKSASVLYGR